MMTKTTSTCPRCNQEIQHTTEIQASMAAALGTLCNACVTTALNATVITKAVR